MKNKLSSPTAVSLTVIAALGRLIPHPANMTPMGASTLFGGSKLARPWNYVAPMLVMFVTDIFLGFHATMIYVYACFLFGAFLGEKFLQKNDSLSRVGLLSSLNAVIFFLVTNYGVWATGTMYAKTFAGLIQCYVMGLPFFGNMLIGDIIFGVGFFALYRYFERTNIQTTFDNTTRSYLVWARK